MTGLVWRVSLGLLERRGWHHRGTAALLTGGLLLGGVCAGLNGPTVLAASVKHAAGAKHAESATQAGAGGAAGASGATASSGAVGTAAPAGDATAGSPAASGTAGGTAGTTTTVAAALNEGAKPGSTAVATVNAALKSNEAGAALEAQIAKLPPLTGTTIDVPKRSAQVLTHLNAVLRFYRAATVPVQNIGEPSDVLYAEESQSEATQIAVLAFQAAKNEAALLKKVAGSGTGKAAATDDSAPADTGQPTEAQRIATVRNNAQARLTALLQQQTDVQTQIPKARGDARAVLLQREQQLEGGIELQKAMVSALGRISTYSTQQTETGLAGDIERLEHSAPELLSIPVKTPAPPVLESLATARDAGVTTQASALFQLMGTLHTIDQQVKAIDALSKETQDLRTPFLKVLRSTIAQGQALSQQTVDPKATPTTDAQDLANTRKQFSDLTNTFQVLASATMPLSQEALLLDNARGSLTTWKATVNAEYVDILRHLLLRVFFIALALGVLALANRILSRAAVRYVNDLRRRRQLLLMRRIVIGFFTGLVLIFGFVTQFSSLATFAGFISAGIAVGLQSILLSVAAYFFIVGRYGVRVGDRITVANVTGEVIEVGLVRFYMMELVGTGTELHSTGRVAVFANSVLFSTGTPIYKQMPGTEYAWHELTAKLNSGADVQAASAAVLATVNDVYATYSKTIQEQHQQVETWMGTALPSPQVESRLQLADGGLQFAVLFPVEIAHAAEVDQKIAEALLVQMRADGAVKAGVAELPVIKAAVKS